MTEQEKYKMEEQELNGNGKIVSSQSIIEYLFLVRHGSYDVSGNLYDSSKENLTKLGKSIADITKDKGPVQIFSSPVLRAAQTAEVLAFEEGIKDISFLEFLADPKNKAEEVGKEFYKSVCEWRKQARTLILVTHAFVPEACLEQFTAQEFRARLRPEYLPFGKELPTGEAYFLNIPLKECKHLPSDKLIYKLE